MKICFLGTGTSQGIPVIGCDCPTCTSNDPKDTRLRTAGYVEQDETSFLIDCGPDFRQQMLQNKIKRLDAVLISHEHNDHVIGIDDLRPLNFNQKMDMPIYGNKRVLDELKFRFAYAFAERPYPGVPRLNLMSVKAYDSFNINELQVESLEIMHGKLPILGFKTEDLVYITDAKTVPEKTIEKIRKCKVLVINALRYKEHNTHFSLQEALDFIKLIEPERAYLTHLSHHFPPAAQLEKELPTNVFIAYDGLWVDL